MNHVKHITREDERVFLAHPVRHSGDLPPGAVLAEMEDLCVGCGDCVEVCPSSLLELDMEGLPRFDVGQSCGVCGLCADVCSFGAIRFTQPMLTGLQRTMRTERELAERQRER